MSYSDFLSKKSQLDWRQGFTPLFVPEFLFDFQRFLVDWVVNTGRAAVFADCGMGKTVMELAVAQNYYLKTGLPSIILTPLSVTSQFVEEGERFGFEVARSRHGEIQAPIVITNYERLHMFSPEDFGGVVLDESSILKSFDGTRRGEITEFMRMHKYRMLATATAAPNDYTELGTSSEALGNLGHMDMLNRFFTTKEGNSHGMNGKWRTTGEKYRFKGHSQDAFWRWVTSWARAARKPSDLGFCDDRFSLPNLDVVYHTIKSATPPPGMLFALPAVGMAEQRAERRRTLDERCAYAAEIADTDDFCVIWCHLNDEGDLLEKIIPGAIQVSGKDSDEQKEEKFHAFSSGEVRVLITKPKIGAWGLNWQHCNHTVYFPSYSYEQFYQATRRFWRYGQSRPVTVDVVATEGEVNTQKAIQMKSDKATKMFNRLVRHMNDGLKIERTIEHTNKMELPAWLS